MIDLKIDSEGNLVIGPDGKEVYVQGDEYLSQCILLRLKTVQGDCLVTPSLGASLESFIGEPMSDDTLENIRQRVIQECSRIKGLDINDVYVSQLDTNLVGIVVEFFSVQNPESYVNLVFGLDLVTGFVESSR